MMTARERLRKALDHVQPDRIPVDFGGTVVSGMHVTCVRDLRNYHGLEQRPVKVCEPYQMLGLIEEDLASTLHLDAEPLPPRNTMFGFPNDEWVEARMPWGQEVLVSKHFKTSQDSNGDLLIYPEGDTSVPPSGRMPAGGYFFDTIIRQEEIDEDNIDPADNLQEFGPVSPEDLAHVEREVQRLAGSERGIVATFAGTALGDIALVPGPFLKHPKGIRDVAEWYVSTVLRPDYVHAVFSEQTDIAVKNLARLHAVTGEAIDVLFLCGTDFGTQTSSFCSPETFKTLYAPYYRTMNDWIHKNTSWKTFKHSCGAVEPFIPLLADAGFDIVNPVQCSATGMNPNDLKDRYGDRITFWGGGVDTQRTLPFGTPDQVRQEVLSRCEIFSPAGGFVFNAVHNIQVNTPVRNIVAMFDAVSEFNGQA